MCLNYYCNKCKKNHHKCCEKCCNSSNKCCGDYRCHHQHKCQAITKPEKCIHKRATTLKVNKLMPESRCSTIGSKKHKFKKIYAKKICVDNYSDYMGPKGPLGPQGLQGSQGSQGPQGPLGQKGDSQFSINTNSALTTTTIRDVPCQQLFPVFYNGDTKEISYDSSIMSYSELVALVLKQQQEIENLKA